MCQFGDQQQVEDGLNQMRSALSHVFHGQPIPPDPLIKELADDPVVAVFHPEAFFSCDTCLIAVTISLCSPLNIPLYLCACGRMCCYPDMFRSFAKSRRFILREHSLLYELEQKAPSHPMGQCCCAQGTVVSEPVQILLLLTDDFTLDGVNETDKSTVVLKFKGQPIACMTLSSVIPDSTGGAIKPFLERLAAQKQAQTFLPAPSISTASKQVHDLVMSYHQFVTAPPQKRNLKSADLERQAKGFYQNITGRVQTIQSGAPLSNEMDRGKAEDHPIVARIAPIEAEMVQDARSPLLDMSTEDILKVLKTLQLAQYCDSFEKSSVNGAMLLLLDDATLVELNVASNLDRKRILAWVLQNK